MTTAQTALTFADDTARPLADRMRPQSFADVLGQDHLLTDGSLFANAIKTKNFPSIIFWGSAGCGKTTMARLIAGYSDGIFVQLSAISHASADLRKVFEQAAIDKEAGKRTILLVDEIHRFNRSQQDLFLPYIENGTIILIGATTETPSFELNSALLSRCKVLILNRLDSNSLKKLTHKAEEFTGKNLSLDEEARTTLCAIADGDARYLLNMVEELLEITEPLDSEKLLTIIQKRMPVYDKSRNGHYNLISALHKSLRGSDVDASLYWLARMIDGGEDPLYILRRLVRFASEDIGLADPNALVQTIAAKDAFEFIGAPEGYVNIAQAAVYLATSPKSIGVYRAMNKALKDAKENGSLSPPKYILNAPTKLMKEAGYGKGYVYDPDTKDGFSGQNYFPEEMPRKKYYNPAEAGFEREIIKRLNYWEKLREKKG
ncbi:MAG: replication-associated recombination protein A [Rickettsiales bacterium]